VNGRWCLVKREKKSEVTRLREATAAKEIRGLEMEATIYCLRSTLLLDILKPLTLATYYEKNCFVLNHGLNRHCVCRFLRGKIGNNRNVNNRNRGNGASFALGDTA
jgi:hypothetical protein